MKVSIVILNWNGKAMLQKYLPSVVRYSQDEAEIIVADNASTDDSLQWLAKRISKGKNHCVRPELWFCWRLQ